MWKLLLQTRNSMMNPVSQRWSTEQGGKEHHEEMQLKNQTLSQKEDSRTSLHCHRIMAAHRRLKASAAVPKVPWEDDLDIRSQFFLEGLGRTTKEWEMGSQPVLGPQDLKQAASEPINIGIDFSEAAKILPHKQNGWTCSGPTLPN